MRGVIELGVRGWVRAREQGTGAGARPASVWAVGGLHAVADGVQTIAGLHACGCRLEGERAGCTRLQAGGTELQAGVCTELQAGGVRSSAGGVGQRAACLRHVDVALRGDALRRGAAAREAREAGRGHHAARAVATTRRALAGGGLAHDLHEVLLHGGDVDLVVEADDVLRLVPLVRHAHLQACGGVVVWWCGGVVVWRCGGVVVWWSQRRETHGHGRHARGAWGACTCAWPESTAQGCSSPHAPLRGRPWRCNAKHARCNPRLQA